MVEDLLNKSDFQYKQNYLVSKYKDKPNFVYAGLVCRIEEEKVVLDKFLDCRLKDNIFTINPVISVIGKEAIVKEPERIETLDLCHVEKIDNLKFLSSLTNLRVLYANYLKEFPYAECLRFLKKLKYLEVKQMTNINICIPENLRIIIKNEVYYLGKDSV